MVRTSFNTGARIFKPTSTWMLAIEKKIQQVTAIILNKISITKTNTEFNTKWLKGKTKTKKDHYKFPFKPASKTAKRTGEKYISIAAWSGPCIYILKRISLFHQLITEPHKYRLHKLKLIQN